MDVTILIKHAMEALNAIHLLRCSQSIEIAKADIDSMRGGIEPPLQRHRPSTVFLSVQEKAFSAASQHSNKLASQSEKDQPHVNKQTARNARSPPRAFLISHAPPARKAATTVPGGLAWLGLAEECCRAPAGSSEGAKSHIAPRHARSARIKGFWIGAVIQTKTRSCFSSSFG